MLNFMPKHKLDKIKEGEGSVVPPVTEPKVESPPPKDAPPAEGEGNNLDELGYEKVPPAEGDKAKVPDPKKEEPKKEEPIKDPSTGYGEEPPKPEDPPAPKEEAPPPDDLDKAIGELPKPEVSKIKDFANKHNLTPEQVKAYGDLRRSELKIEADRRSAQEKEAEQERVRIRSSWHKELKEDKDFGGANFAANVSKAERVLQDFMPQTKKELTERKLMLPPCYMRDLAKLGDHLYATEKLVQGEPKLKEVAENEVDDALAFYQ